jgi:hypothetical protein
MVEEIDKLPVGMRREKNFAQDHLNALKTSVTAFKALSPDLQTLQIPEIAARMCNIFYYVAALQQGNHQKNEMGSASKLVSAEYFRQVRLSEQAIAKDDDYLDLIARVVAAG